MKFQAVLEFPVVDLIQQIREQRERQLASTAKAAAEADGIEAELSDLVKAAFNAGHTWQELSQALGVSRARVYQIRDRTR